MQSYKRNNRCRLIKYGNGNTDNKVIDRKIIDIKNRSTSNNRENMNLYLLHNLLKYAHLINKHFLRRPIAWITKTPKILQKK